jgi:hypothetical protein
MQEIQLKEFKNGRKPYHIVSPVHTEAEMCNRRNEVMAICGVLKSLPGSSTMNDAVVGHCALPYIHTTWLMICKKVVSQSHKQMDWVFICPTLKLEG